MSDLLCNSTGAARTARGASTAEAKMVNCMLRTILKQCKAGISKWETMHKLKYTYITNVYLSTIAIPCTDQQINAKLTIYGAIS